MRVLVAGAAGVIGRRLIPRLAEAGHEVAGISRNPERAARLEAIGARPLVCDVYDRAKLVAAMENSPSDVVVHLLTDLPARFDPRAGTSATNRLRREGTRSLLEAARAAGARRVVAGSIAFLYRPGSPSLKDEQDPPWLDAPGSFAETVRAAIDLERQVLQALWADGVVLRFGWLYGPGTWFAPDGSIAEDVRGGSYPIIGDRRGTWSFVHVDDAASAVLAAVHQGRPGIYNIVDDDPAPMHVWLPAFAEAAGAPKPSRLQNVPPHMAADRRTAGTAGHLAGASNTKSRRELGWTPRYPSWRAGFHALEPPIEYRQGSVRSG